MMKLIISKIADENTLNEINDYGDTALMLVLGNKHADEECVQWFMSNENIHMPNKEKNYPIHQIIYGNKIEALKFFIKNNVDFTIKDIQGDTVLHYAAFFCKDKEIVNLIKSKCNQVSLNEKNNEEETPLMYALEQNSDEKLIELFMSNENINIPNKNDEYPIDLAIKNERNEVLKMLQEKNAKSSSINL